MKRLLKKNRNDMIQFKKINEKEWHYGKTKEV